MFSSTYYKSDVCASKGGAGTVMQTMESDNIVQIITAHLEIQWNTNKAYKLSEDAALWILLYWKCYYLFGQTSLVWPEMLVLERRKNKNFHYQSWLAADVVYSVVASLQSCINTDWIILMK